MAQSNVSLVVVSYLKHHPILMRPLQPSRWLQKWNKTIPGCSILPWGEFYQIESLMQPHSISKKDCQSWHSTSCHWVFLADNTSHIFAAYPIFKMDASKILPWPRAIHLTWHVLHLSWSLLLHPCHIWKKGGQRSGCIFSFFLSVIPLLVLMKHHNIWKWMQQWKKPFSSVLHSSQGGMHKTISFLQPHLVWNEG